MTIKILKTLGVLLAGALLLAACGTKKAPTYNGGGYSSPTTTTTIAKPANRFPELSDVGRRQVRFDQLVVESEVAESELRLHP